MQLKAVDVWKSYEGNNYVLQGVTFSVKKGEVVAIRGRSGSGKTTLLNIIGCLDTPTKGDIYINGTNLAHMSRRDLAALRLRTVGHIFQNYNLIEDLTVLENVMLPMKLAKIKNARERALELLCHFEVEQIAHKKPGEISGGEMQRAAIARALANKPKILIADEPTASLDLDNSVVVLETFLRVNKEMNTTIIIAAHDPLIVKYVNKCYTLERGKIKVGEHN